jgi:anti-sigma regulatory factor (Ser/Thr protein kinase)
MTSDEPPVQQGWRPQPEAAAPSVLDQCFDASSLSALRASTQACAAQAGMPAERAADVVIALHELAANAVRHGAGSGRLRIWDHADALYCRVDDDGSVAEPPPGAIGAGSARQNLADRWPREPGHGLWVARKVADQMTLRSDARGTSVVITFSLSAIADPLDAAVYLRGQVSPWERRPGT